MYIHNADTEAEEVAENWIATYGNTKCDLAEFVKSFPPKPTADQLDLLFAMGPERTREARTKREFKCYECGQRFPEVVYVGEISDYGINLCKGCVKKLYEFFR